MSIDIRRNYDANVPTDREAARNRQKDLDKLMEDFLGRGGKIERIPTGMTGEQYREIQKGTKKKKARKSAK